jgi:hypothetical protein
MADLPQHLAVAALIEHLHEPSFDLARYFEVDFSRTLYLLPYGLCIGLGRVLGLRLAMHVVVALSSVLYLAAIGLLLRARQQPAWLAVLALPFIYNRAFYWGFLNFNLGLALGLMAFALMARSPRRGGLELLAASCALLSVVTHVYGVALLLACAGGWALFEPREVLARWRVLVPATLGAAVWALLIRSAPGIEKLAPPLSPSFVERLADFPRSVLGGSSDGLEPALLVLTVAVTLALAGVPRSMAAVKALPALERVLWAGALLNLVLYFVLPQGTESAGFVHFRHAALGLGLLPALARAPTRERSMAGPVLVGVASVAVSLVHLVGFDREARSFDAVLAVMPPAARVLYLPLDPNGASLETLPYLHFGAYVQAERGGFVAQSFPQLFWNVPVKTRAGAVPPLMPGLEFAPQKYDDAFFGGFFDYVLVRMPGDEALEAAPRFPFERVWVEPPWQLYRRTALEHP